MVENRANGFAERVETALAAARADGRAAAVLVVGLGACGADVGDAVAERLRRSVRATPLPRPRDVDRPATDAVARLAGNTVAVLLGGLEDPASAALVAERLRQRLHAPVYAGGRRVPCPVSIGLALAGPGRTAAALLRDATAAMAAGAGSRAGVAG